MMAAPTMPAPPWTTLLMIALGSMTGALLRQAVMLVLSGTAELTFGLAIAVSGLGAVMIGAIIGAVAASTIETNRRQMVMIGLIATLGSFAAAAVMDPSLRASDAAERLWYTAALHIGVAMVAAAFGMIVVRRFRKPSRSG